MQNPSVHSSILNRRPSQGDQDITKPFRINPSRGRQHDTLGGPPRAGWHCPLEWQKNRSDLLNTPFHIFIALIPHTCMPSSLERSAMHSSQAYLFLKIAPVIPYGVFHSYSLKIKTDCYGTEKPSDHYEALTLATPSGNLASLTET